MKKSERTAQLLPRQTPRATLLATPSLLLACLLALAIVLLQMGAASAQGTLTVEIITSYNLVVDSNAMSPSTYAPSLATVMGRFCNTGVDPLTNVQGYIGNYVDGTNDTPGVYPSRDSTVAPFPTQHPDLANSGNYAFVHVGGRLGTADASRYIGTLNPGECKVQYWHFKYPQCKNVLSGGQWVWDDPPCATVATWGDSVKPDDDLWLEFDIWGTGIDNSSGTPVTRSADQTWTMTMRNEISALANKIQPNPDGYWFNYKPGEVSPGDVITSNGILYEFGNIRQGFDNDGDFVPDYNAWAQPIGDASFDPSCFRLIRTTGVLTVTRGAGNPTMIVPFTNQLYFTNLPPDNTGVRGDIHYTFLALDGPCSTAMSPYQEVASGFDNEKFNGDYGTAVPPIESKSPEVDIDKTGNTTVAKPGTITYQIPFQNNSPDTPAGLTLASGFGVDMPLVISDTVPNGLEYVCNSADYSLNYSPNQGVTIRYSKDSGKTWNTSQAALWTECADLDPNTNPASTSPNSLIVIQWWLNDPLPTSTNDGSGQAIYQARVPGTYSSPIVENCAEGSFGAAAPFDRACATTLVEGTGEIGNRVWKDENRNGVQDAAETTQINNVTLYLYWDKNSDGQLDAGDVLVATQDSGSTSDPDESNTNYNFTDLPDGNYLVKINKLDPDIDTVAQGYTLTTAEIFAVTLSAGSNDYNNADFGFGPTLRLDKTLQTSDPAGVGSTVAFRIDLVNDLPGDGTANGYCVYDVWPSATETDSSANKQFLNIANAVGAPNHTYASASLSTGGNRWMAGSAYGSAGRTSGITSVKAVVDFYLSAKLIDDGMKVSLLGGATAWSHTFGAADLNSHAPGEGKKGQLTVTIPGTAAPGGSWDWADFNNPALKLQIDMDKVGKAESTVAVLFVDAFGFRVATDDTSCGGADTTINPLPLTDTYNSTYLQFLYAEPPASSQTAGTITWDNLGPLYAGGTKTVMVYFKALATIASPGTTNTASSTTAKFANGRSANSVTDNATLYIVSSFSLSGRTWIDTGGTLGWTGTTGYDPIPATDQALPNVKIDLYVCVGAAGKPIAQDTNRNTACGADPNLWETWQLVGTKYTDYNGNYTFDGLVPGYYNVRANDKNLPAGMTQRDGEASGAADGTGIGGNPCATCDGAWNEQATVVKNLSYKSANTTQVNFGYRNPSYGTVTGYVWHDQDEGGYNDWDSTEPPIPGATVTLYCEGTGCGQFSYTTTTDQNGYYQFSNLPVTNATYHVVVTPPGGMGQTADPNYSSGSCYGDPTNCDNQTNTFTLAAGGAHGPDLFGYYGGLNIGDTVYVDWDGDGTQDSGEEGIGGVVVYLYLDSNGNGVLDSGEPRLATLDTAYDTGWYEFTNVAGGSSYVVVVNTSTLPAGYAQTGDPDESGTCVTCDSKDPLTLASSDYLDADFGYRPRGFSSIGDTVWLDADADGIQDTNESGILGVTVNLYQDQDGDGVIDAEDALVGTRTTMAYNVVDGYIDVDGDGTPNESNEDIADLHGVEVIDGALDIDGNGVINTNDDGTFVGYTVIDGRLDINNSGSATTADDGSLYGRYQFLHLLAGNYIIEIPSSNFGTGEALEDLTQSYDPDSATVLDNQDQVTLGSAETYVLGDFGYTSSAIGDTVWQDNNGNGLQDGGELGIANVRVELWRDTDNDGVGDVYVTYQDTDSNGHYYFTGLTAGDYVVIVAASNFNSGQPLYNFTQTYDPDASTQPCGGECDNQGKLVDTGPGYGLPLGQVDYSLDFGYRPLGVIGDTLWIDNDNNGMRDAGESGIANITVYLCTNSPCNDTNDIAQTSTDENGYYSFGNLADDTYYVGVHTSDPEFPSGLTQTYDPDETLDNQGSNIVMSGGVVTSIGGYPCDDCDMDVDFGYRYSGLNSISGTVYHDDDDDAFQDPGETTTYSDVTIYLWNCGGDLTCGTSDDVFAGSTVTDANGGYSFTDLPDGRYVVSVNPDAPNLTGLDPTVTTSPTTYREVNLDQTGIDPNPVNVTDQDFGFLSRVDMGDLPASYGITSLAEDGARHVVPAAGAIYLGSAPPDVEANGQESAMVDGDDNDGNDDEDGVIATPGVTWAAGSNGGSIDVTVGGCSGTCYLSGWIDWGNDDSLDEAGDRILLAYPVMDGTQTITFDIPVGTSLDTTYYARFRLFESKTGLTTLPTGVAINGEVEDHLFDWTPTAVKLISFTAAAQDNAILLEWETATEIDNLGFNLYRAGSADGPQARINETLIPGQAPGSPIGAAYAFLDETVVPGTIYYYWLEDVDIYGVATRHGPVWAVIHPSGLYHLYFPRIGH